MNRITVELVREAYTARGTKPCYCQWSEGNCECPAIALARHIGGYFNLDDDEDYEYDVEDNILYERVAKILSIPEKYLRGFIDGVDGIAFDSGASDEWKQGFHDGALVSRTFIE